MSAALLLMSAASLRADSYDCCYDDCCYDENNLYVEIFGGANFLQVGTPKKHIHPSYDTGYMIDGAIGYRWNCGPRVEFEYAYRRNNLDNIKIYDTNYHPHGHLQTSSYMGNFLWDFNLAQWGYNCWDITPFIGAGIGYDVQQIKAHREVVETTDVDPNFHKEKKGFAWQVIAGLGYPIMCNANITLEYKFHRGPLTHVNNHTVGVGLVYQFNLGL